MAADRARDHDAARGEDPLRADRRSARAPRSVLRRLVRVVVVLVLVLVLAVGGLVATVYLQAKTRDLGSGEYVSLGSSFAAGPGVTRRADGSPWLCDQSADNYAHLVARDRGLELTDMSCSGAVTGDVLDGGQYFQGPQLEAVTSRTRLVTITVGGNDVSYLGNLFAWSCAKRSGDVPTAFRLAGVCDEHSRAEVDRAFADLPDRLTEVVDRVRDQAPRAQVVLVDYATVLPATGTCAALPMTAEQVDRGREVAERLRQVTRDVAAQTGATLVQASEVTADHSICSDDPWVYGFEWGSNPLGHPVFPYHPTEEAMAAIADAVEQAVD